MVRQCREPAALLTPAHLATSRRSRLWRACFPAKESEWASLLSDAGAGADQGAACVQMHLQMQTPLWNSSSGGGERNKEGCNLREPAVHGRHGRRRAVQPDARGCRRWHGIHSSPRRPLTYARSRPHTSLTPTHHSFLSTSGSISIARRALPDPTLVRHTHCPKRNVVPVFRNDPRIALSLCACLAARRSHRRPGTETKSDSRPAVVGTNFNSAYGFSCAPVSMRPLPSRLACGP